MIFRLKSALISASGSESVTTEEPGEKSDALKQRKIEGLLKLIQEKNQHIESLKGELSELKSRGAMANSTSDLNSSFTNSLGPSASLVNGKSGQLHFQPQSAKILMESLEKEIQIYKNLNSSTSSSQAGEDNRIKENLQEIIKLRNDLFRAYVLKESNPAHAHRKSRQTATLSFSSTGNLFTVSTSDDNRCTDSLLSFVSPRSEWPENMPDSGLVSQQSEATLASAAGSSVGKRSTSNSGTSANEAPKQMTTTAKPRSQSSHSYIKQNSVPTQHLITRLTDLSYKNQSRDELISLIQTLSNDNTVLRRQLESKAVGLKVTELHNELAKLREKLEQTEHANETYRKQLEVANQATRNMDAMHEMTQKLNMTKEELDQYKEKLTRIQDLNESITSTSNRRSSLYLANLNASNGILHLPSLCLSL